MMTLRVVVLALVLSIGSGGAFANTADQQTSEAIRQHYVKVESVSAPSTNYIMMTPIQTAGDAEHVTKKHIGTTVSKRSCARFNNARVCQ